MYFWKDLDSPSCIDLLSANAPVSKFSKFRNLRNRAVRFLFKDFGCYEGKSLKKLQPRISNLEFLTKGQSGS